jgi:hypothetical protein
MALEIIDLSYHKKPAKGKNYFFDTNVLLFVMGVRTGALQEEKYINFFNSVYSATMDGENRIITTSLQISELFNRLLKLESNKAYSKQKYAKGEYAYYKDVYRKSEAIKTSYAQFKSDFMAYQGAFDVLPCQLVNIEKILDFSPADTDVNDHIYMQLVKSAGAIMVTHDSDLICEDMPVLTLNKTLVFRNRNFTVVPKDQLKMG